jgi:hypothetical protein
MSSSAFLLYLPLLLIPEDEYILSLKMLWIEARSSRQ